jgi:heat shock protein HslJ
MRNLTHWITALFVVAACTSAGDIGSLQNRDWTLTWVEGFTTLPSAAATPTIRFGSDGRLGGNTGCNSAGAAYTVQGDRLDIEALMATKRACLDPRGNDLERAYINAVERMTRYRIAGGELQLLDDAGTVLARFR